MIYRLLQSVARGDDHSVCRKRVVADIGGYQWYNPVMTQTKIVSNPEIMGGKPVIDGTRITVEFILEKLAAGESMEQILAAHPRLSREGITAALEYAILLTRKSA